MKRVFFPEEIIDVKARETTRGSIPTWQNDYKRVTDFMCLFLTHGGCETFSEN
jgi:hypothetical protein